MVKLENLLVELIEAQRKTGAQVEDLRGKINSRKLEFQLEELCEKVEALTQIVKKFTQKETIHRTDDVKGLTRNQKETTPSVTINQKEKIQSVEALERTIEFVKSGYYSEYEEIRDIYERALNRNPDLNIWITYADFEAHAMQEGSYEPDLPSDDEQKIKCLKRARAVFERAYAYFKNSAPEMKKDRATLLEEWVKVERNFGEIGDTDSVRAKMPTQLTKIRQIESEDGLEYESFKDYYFPGETSNSKS